VGGSISTGINKDSRTAVFSVSLVSITDTLTAQLALPAPVPGRPSPFTFDAIGTRWCIDTDEPLNGEVRDRILDRVRRFDRTYSRFRPDSLVAQVAAAPAGGRFEFPNDSIALFDLYDRFVTATDGAVDPLVGRQLELLGYDPTYSFMPAPAAVRIGERARENADVGGGHRPGWRDPHHAASARDRRRSGRQGLPRRHHLDDPPSDRGGRLRRRRRRRPPP
jgi:hypothetical protein